ncbi:MAG: hypothetical protein ACTSRP_20235, partial [Candidatus Helarchaeota archaeon]
EFLAKLINSAVKAGLEFVRTIAEAAMAAIEAMMKAALLAWIYYEFSQTLLICLGIIFILGIFLNIFKSFYNIDVNYSPNEIQTSGLISISINMEILYEYNKFLDIECPAIQFIFVASEIIAKFFYGFFEFQVKIEKFLYGNETAPTLISNIFEFLSSMGDVMTINGGFVGVHAVVLEAKKEQWTRVMRIGIISYIFGFLLWLYVSLKNFNFNILFGVAIGFFISGVIFLSLYRYLKSKEHTRPKNIHKQYMKKFEEIFRIKSAKNPDGFIPIKVLTILDAILGYIDIELKFRDIVIDEDQSASQQAAEMTMSVFAGFLSMFLACYSIINFSGGKTYYYKMKVSRIYTIITLLCGIIILRILIKEIENNSNP